MNAKWLGNLLLKQRSRSIVFVSQTEPTNFSKKNFILHIQKQPASVWDRRRVHIINLFVGANRACCIASHAGNSQVPHHTKIYVRFQPRKCWGLCCGILGVGPSLFALIHGLKMQMGGVRTGRCDQPLEQRKSL